MLSVYSDQWHLVSDLKPKLRQNAEIHRHLYRNQVWYLLRDETTGQFHRFSENAYQIIGLLDGRYNLNDIWHLACEKLGDEMPTQDEIIELLQKLYNANALNSEISSDIERFSQRRETLVGQKKLKQFATPFGLKLPLFQPQQLLENYQFFGKLFFSRTFLVMLVLLWVAGINITVTHWEGLTNNLSDRLLAPDGLLLMAVIYPIIKIIHEFAHAFAVKKYGGEVHEMGVMLLVFFPVPYVDASAANGFSSKYQRMLVAASGILAELTLAALALLVWVSAEEGVLRALAFYVAITAGVSSLFFNGNPLLRFDAYYVLADWLELPNLANRSNKHLGHLFKKYVFRLPNQVSEAMTLGEASIFVFYGIAAFIYRILIFVWIGLFVAESYWFIGVMMIIWAGTVTLLVPAYKNWSKLLASAEVKNNPGKFWSSFSSLVGLVLFLLAWLPMPYTTDFEGTLPATQSFALKTEAEGQLTQLYVKNGQAVRQGDLIANLDAAELNLEIASLQAKLKQVQVKRSASILKPLERRWLLEEQKVLQQDLALKQQQLTAKQMFSPYDGIWINPSLALGQFFQRGEIVGYINPQAEGIIHAMISEADMSLLGENSEVQIRFASLPLRTFRAEILDISPSASKDLVSPVLAQAGGGRIVLDESKEMQTLESFFLLRFQTEKGLNINNLEERVYVVVKHPSEPLIYRWMRQVRQSFLSKFDV